MTPKRDSYPWLRLLAVAAVMVVVGYGIYGIGCGVDWMSSTAWGANP